MSFSRIRKKLCRLVLLHEKYSFSRPLTVTAAYLKEDGVVFFHQMVLDRIENDEYILQNNQFRIDGSIIRISRREGYYASYDVIISRYDQNSRDYVYYGDNNEFMRLVNEKTNNMRIDRWYLLPQAYMIFLHHN